MRMIALPVSAQPAAHGMAHRLALYLLDQKPIAAPPVLLLPREVGRVKIPARHVVMNAALAAPDAAEEALDLVR